MFSNLCWMSMLFSCFWNKTWKLRLHFGSLSSICVESLRVCQIKKKMSKWCHHFLSAISQLIMSSYLFCLNCQSFECTIGYRHSDQWVVLHRSASQLLLHAFLNRTKSSVSNAFPPLTVALKISSSTCTIYFFSFSCYRAAVATSLFSLNVYV